MQDFLVEITQNTDAVVFKPIGTIDSVTTPTLQNHLKSAIDNEQYLIVVDLSEIQFISSSGLGLLLGTVETLRGNGGDLVLMAVPYEVLCVLEIMSVDDYFRMIDSLDEMKNPMC